MWLDLFREKKPRQFRVDVSWVLISAWNVLSFSAGEGVSGTKEPSLWVLSPGKSPLRCCRMYLILNTNLKCLIVRHVNGLT